MPWLANAQLSVSPQADLQQLAETITGDGVRSRTRDDLPSGRLRGVHLRWGPLGINEGIILTSGTIGNAVGPNDVGEQVLSAIHIGQRDPRHRDRSDTRDACMFEFDIIPGGDSLTFDFVFASEEYSEWVGSQYNDVFGFFISGPASQVTRDGNVTTSPWCLAPTRRRHQQHQQRLEQRFLP